MLFRKFQATSFQFLSLHGWKEPQIVNFSDVLSSGPLNSTDTQIPIGITYHTSEVFLSSLRNGCMNQEGFPPPSQSTFLSLLSPFFTILKTSNSKLLTSKILESVFGCLRDYLEMTNFHSGGQEEVDPVDQDTLKESEWFTSLFDGQTLLNALEKVYKTDHVSYKSQIRQFGLKFASVCDLNDQGWAPLIQVSKLPGIIIQTKQVL